MPRRKSKVFRGAFVKEKPKATKSNKTTKSRKPKTRITIAIQNLNVAFSNVDNTDGGKALASEILKAIKFLENLGKKIV